PEIEDVAARDGSESPHTPLSPVPFPRRRRVLSKEWGIQREIHLVAPVKCVGVRGFLDQIHRSLQPCAGSPHWGRSQTIRKSRQRASEGAHMCNRDLQAARGAADRPSGGSVLVELLVSTPWPGIVLWTVLYCSDYLLTLTGARLYRQGVS